MFVGEFKIKKLILVLILCIFLTSCESRIKEKEIQGNAECAVDSDCSAGGCSGQVCTAKEKAKGLITTCEWKEEYSCLKLTSCSCINDKCQWEDNSDYKECIDNIK